MYLLVGDVEFGSSEATSINRVSEATLWWCIDTMLEKASILSFSPTHSINSINELKCTILYFLLVGDVDFGGYMNQQSVGGHLVVVYRYNARKSLYSILFSYSFNEFNDVHFFLLEGDGVWRLHDTTERWRPSRGGV